MKNLTDKWISWSHYIHGLLRIVAAIMFMMAGSMNLFAFPIGMPPNGETVELISQMGLAGNLEFFGGALLLLGLYTKPVAFILAGEMAVAYFQAHFPQSFWPIVNGGQPAILYCFI